MCSGARDAALPTPGFPIRASPDHSLLAAPRGNFVACYALHRLSVPRHPPCALISLTNNVACGAWIYERLWKARFPKAFCGSKQSFAKQRIRRSLRLRVTASDIIGARQPNLLASALEYWYSKAILLLFSFLTSDFHFTTRHISMAFRSSSFHHLAWQLPDGSLCLQNQ